jgi:uncharacterized coiled-coil DUF342 family protein
MDKQTLAVMIPVIVVSIPLVAVILSGYQKVIKLRTEEARVRAGADGSNRQIDELRAEVDQLRHELGEVQERLDFTERLLARGSDRAKPLPQ